MDRPAVPYEMLLALIWKSNLRFSSTARSIFKGVKHCDVYPKFQPTEMSSNLTVQDAVISGKSSAKL